MQNIPVFDTQNGVASLILREIPYTATAYVHIIDTQAPEDFLHECVSFCRAVGAERIYGTGHISLEKYPLHTSIWKMAASVRELPQTNAALLSVTEKTLEQWRDIYNKAMITVPNASFMTSSDAHRMHEEGSGFFVFRDDQLLGIGMVKEDTLDAVVSVVKGSGSAIVSALCSQVPSNTVFLQVASTNERAIRLYDRLGFAIAEELSKWYKIF